MKFEEIKGFVRHLLTFGGGFLVSADILEATQVDTVVGGLIAIIGVVFSVLNKRKTE